MTGTPGVASGRRSAVIHGFTPRSRANGPGVRAAIWFQGCSLGCPGCFNPATHDFAAAAAESVAIADLVGRILAEADAIEGVTLSGGEPLDQAEAVLELLTELRRVSELSVLLFSGYRREEIATHPFGPAILALCDVLIDGRYQKAEQLSDGLRGSANQQIHLLTGRYRLEEVTAVPPGEVIISPDGEVVVTGIDPLPLKLSGW